jgi:RNA polymerase sigma-70 factor (ECF subfamily)
MGDIALQVPDRTGPLVDVVQDAVVRVVSDRLETVYRVEGPRLWRALLAYAADPDLASDALAEAFAQAIARGEAIRDPAAWVWRVAFRVAAGDLKERRRHEELVVEPSYELPESLAYVFDALRKLSPNQRLAVVLHDYADRTTDEIAAVLGATRATVHVHLSQGRRRLRRLLEDDDG